MNRKHWAPVFLCLVMLAAGAGAASAGTESFNGVAFGTPAGELKSFLKLKSNGPIDYYVNLNESYEIPGFPNPIVFYGFVDGKLYAAYVRLDSANAYAALKKSLTGKYGKPKIKQDGEIVVNRWTTGDVTIKLKADMQNAVMRLAYYYEPAIKDRNILSEQLDTGMNFKDLMQEWQRQGLKK